MKFKYEQRLKEELKKLALWNPALYRVVLDLDAWVTAKLKKEIVLTMIFRTEQEQDEIYKNDPKYQAKKFKSPHQLWCGVDIRSSIFTADEIRQVVDYLNLTWNGSNGFTWTAKCHNVGIGDHFHLQYVKKM